MHIKDLMPWNWGRHSVPVRREDEERLRNLQSDINRVFEDFWHGFPAPAWTAGIGAPFETMSPVELSETDEEIEISAELPGMSEDDIDVTMSADMLKIKGQKTSERDEKRQAYHITERSYGAVHRTIPLPSGLDLDHVDATFKDGVLKVRIPKTEEARSEIKRIAVTKS